MRAFFDVAVHKQFAFPCVLGQRGDDFLSLQIPGLRAAKKVKTAIAHENSISSEDSKTPRGKPDSRRLTPGEIEDLQREKKEINAYARVVFAQPRTKK